MMSVSAQTASAIIGFTLAFAIVGKLRNLKAFSAAIGEYPFIPRSAEAPIGIAIVLLEGLAAFSHLSLDGLSFFAPVAVAMFVCFGALTARTLYLGEVRACLCFGAGRTEQVGFRTLLRLILLASIGLWLVAVVHLRDDWSTQHRSLDAYVTAVIILVLAQWMFSLPEFRKLAVIDQWRTRRLSRLPFARHVDREAP